MMKVFYPSNLFQNKSPNLTSVSRYLRGWKVKNYKTNTIIYKKTEKPPVPKHIGAQINYLHEVTNQRSHQAKTIGSNSYCHVFLLC